MPFPPRAAIRRPGAAPRRFGTRLIPRLGLAAAALVANGCWVFVVSGPSTVVVGDTVTYVLSLGADQSADPDLLAEVPEGWQLESATYDAFVGGQLVSGDAVAVDGAPLCSFMLGEQRPGFRRWKLQPAEPLPVGSGDVATVTLVFLVDSQPAGEFNLYFILGGFAGITGCSELEGFAVNRRGPRSLALLKALFDGHDGVDGLDGARRAALSPDGEHVYVAGEDDRAVAAFDRDPETGGLTFVEVEIDGVDGVDGLEQPQAVAASPDGRHLYAGGPGAIAVFARDPATGELDFIERLLDDAETLALSPDGRHLYAASSGGVTAYARDETSGELTFIASAAPGGRIAFSPDGRYLYAARINTIAIFRRDEASGELTPAGLSATGSVHQVAVSPDGRHLYAVGGEVRALTLFDRDPATGSLSFVEAEIDPTGDGLFLNPQALAISPDGRLVVTAGREATVIWERQKTSGRLTRAGVLWAGNLPVEGLAAPGVVAFAAGGRHLYGVATSSDAVLALGTAVLFADGFESGTTAAWSSVIP